MRLLTAAALTFATGLLAQPDLALAQESGSTTRPDVDALISVSLLRATNVARMRAEKLNGGLTVYRPAGCMYQRGGGDCLVSSSSEGYVFRFLGGGPGWQQLQHKPAFETEIRISADGREVLEVIYNGAPRPQEQEPQPGAGSPDASGPEVRS